MSPRNGLSRERVLQAALELADGAGLDSLSMRKLAREVGVEAMSLYHHVAGREDLVDGLVDLVFGEVEVPRADDWKDAMRARASSMRAAMRRHPWAVDLMEGRMHPGPESLRVHDATLGRLRESGFAFRAAISANSLMDAYIYGFALMDRTLPDDVADNTAEIMRAQARHAPDMSAYPHLVEAMTEFASGGYDPDAAFAFGLELILDGLEGLRG